MATQNQRRVIAKIVDKVRRGEKVSVSQEMKGIYSKHTARQPDRITKSKAWTELMEEFIPDELLAKRHKWLLKKDSHQAVANGLSLGYKLKGHFAPEKKEVKSRMLMVTTNLSEDETQKLKKLLGK
jgi:hypothetical protein